MSDTFYEDIERAFRVIGVYKVKSDSESMSERRRSHSAISIRIKGKSSFFYGENGDSRKDAADGTVVYIPSGFDYHRITGGSEERIAVHLDEVGGESCREIETVDGCGELVPLFEALLSEWEAGGSTCYNKVMQLFYGILAELQKLNGDATSVPSSIAAGVRLMERSFRDPELRISVVADACHVSEVYFRRVFNAHFGVSPVKMLTDMRFGYAEKLLATGYYKIKEVAYLSGFSDAKYFRAAFVKRYGTSPRTYTDRVGKF